MYCIVKGCTSARSLNTEVIFHLFPQNEKRLMEWMSELPLKEPVTNESRICTLHFKKADYNPVTGKLYDSAKPFQMVYTEEASINNLVCRICLSMNTKQYNIQQDKWRDMYQQLTGLKIDEEDKFPSKLCWECAHRLITCWRFKSIALRSHELMLDLLNSKHCLTLQDIIGVDRQYHELTSNLTRSTFVDQWDVPVDMVSGEITEELEMEDKVVLSKDPATLWRSVVDSVDVHVKREEDAEDTSRECHEVANDKSEVPNVKSADVRHYETELKEPGTEIKTENDASSYNVDFCVIKQEIEIKHEAAPYEELPPDMMKKTCSTGTMEDVTCASTLVEHSVREETNFTNSEISRIPVSNTKSSRKNNPQFLVERPQGKEKPHVCSYCGVGYTRNSDLNRHMKRHSGERTYACDHCDYKSTDIYRLKRHYKVHADKVQYACNYCEFKCIRKANLNIHIKTHTGEKPFACNYCAYRSVRKCDLNIHLKTHTGEKAYACDRCKFKCIQKTNLLRHIKTHTGEKPFACSYCEYRSATKHQLNNHIKIHTCERLFQCRHCNYKSAYKHLLEEHLKTHMGEELYGCKHCEYKTSAKYNLKLHMKTHVSGEFVYCHYCSYRSANKRDLIKHLETHSEEKRHSCTYCEYRCDRKSSLIVHIKTHTGEKPHACKYCEFKFVRKTNLNRHMKTHTGEKPHACSYCNYKSIRKDHLSSHMKKHIFV